MDSTKLVNWLQILGNFGLIAGLVLVAAQIQQNSEITEAQMVSEDRALAVTLRLAVLGENPAMVMAKAIDSPGELTTEDMFVLQAFEAANYYHKSRNEMLHRVGFGTNLTGYSNPEGNAVGALNEYLGTPHGIASFDVLERRWEAGAPKTRKELAKLLENHEQPQHIVSEQFAQIRAHIESLATPPN